MSVNGLIMKLKTLETNFLLCYKNVYAEPHLRQSILYSIKSYLIFCQIVGLLRWQWTLLKWDSGTSLRKFV